MNVVRRHARRLQSTKSRVGLVLCQACRERPTQSTSKTTRTLAVTNRQNTDGALRRMISARLLLTAQPQTTTCAPATKKTHSCKLPAFGVLVALGCLRVHLQDDTPSQRCFVSFHVHPHGHSNAVITCIRDTLPRDTRCNLPPRNVGAAQWSLNYVTSIQASAPAWLNTGISRPHFRVVAARPGVH